MDKMIYKVMQLITELQPYEEFNETTNLLEEDVLDSVAVLALVQELEEEFSITIQVEEITGENFETVNSIVALVNNKKIGE